MSDRPSDQEILKFARQLLEYRKEHTEESGLPSALEEEEEVYTDRADWQRRQWELEWARMAATMNVDLEPTDVGAICEGVSSQLSHLMLQVDQAESDPSVHLRVTHDVIEVDMSPDPSNQWKGDPEARGEAVMARLERYTAFGRETLQSMLCELVPRLERFDRSLPGLTVVAAENHTATLERHDPIEPPVETVET